ncbi:MAG: nucleotide sugar dehydrogenase [Gammaproteobacteria bacterium]|nr:nucleotide sugar dehydrogenase [Gammaproteobacteria bacterium]MDP2346982.1 nucleotide sugar dehydrogenase [Gammaproteobacteria bacterium]
MSNLNRLTHAEQFPGDNASYHTQLSERITAHTARIAVIGQGYVGLPLAAEFCHAGFRVTGLDIDKERVRTLNRGESLTPDVSDATLLALRNAGYYEATWDFSVLRNSDVIVICVPTPLRKSKDPDISYVLATVEQVVKHLCPGQLIILESTTYPGTTEELLLPLFEEKGYVAGQDVFLAFSPERIDPGNKQFTVKDIPKITGGVTPACTQLAAMFYRQIVGKVVEVSSPRVAELAKLYENVFRSVNIALANEFSLMCRQLGVSSREVIDAAASKPFGFMPFYPGPGIGGHCIPIDPAYLAWKLKFSNYQARFIPLAEEINQSMPGYVVDLVSEALNERKLCLNGANVLAIGVAYKRGVGDIRESPALQIMASLSKLGVNISYSDPHVPEIVHAGNSLRSVAVDAAILKACDCVLILTDHAEFDYQQMLMSASLIVDTRGAMRGLSGGNAQIVSL